MAKAKAAKDALAGDINFDVKAKIGPALAQME